LMMDEEKANFFGSPARIGFEVGILHVGDYLFILGSVKGIIGLLGLKRME